MTPKARKQRAELLPEMLNTVSWSGAILELRCPQTFKARLFVILNMQAFKKLLTQLLLKTPYPHRFKFMSTLQLAYPDFEFLH